MDTEDIYLDKYNKYQKKIEKLTNKIQKAGGASAEKITYEKLQKFTKYGNKPFTSSFVSRQTSLIKKSLEVDIIKCEATNENENENCIKFSKYNINHFVNQLADSLSYPTSFNVYGKNTNAILFELINLDNLERSLKEEDVPLLGVIELNNDQNMEQLDENYFVDKNLFQILGYNNKEHKDILLIYFAFFKFILSFILEEYPAKK